MWNDGFSPILEILISVECAVDSKQNDVVDYVVLIFSFRKKHVVLEEQIQSSFAYQQP